MPSPRPPMPQDRGKEMPPVVPPAGTVGADGSVQTSATGSKSAFAAAGSEARNVMSAIKKYESEVGLAYEEVPADLCDGRYLELNAWSLIANDNTLKQVADATRRRMDARAETVMKELKYDQRISESVAQARKIAIRTAAANVGTEHLHLHGAADIGDLGMKEIGDHCFMLKSLDIGGAFKVSDVGLRCVALSCTALTQLNLSSCLGIAGVGLSVVGETAPNLTSLNISNCQQLANWAFQKVCSGCPLLEDVNLSHCLKITDHDLKVMAQHCTRIRKLNVRDTRQVSDGGLVEVAKNCPSLEWLNTSRSEMPFKITDVGLLSVAENCPLLRHLEVQGCDCVTDVGLTWLGRGCRCLVHLDIKNCSKVTNAGVRSISEGCHLLEYLDLTNIKRVTDVGVRHIAHHCTKIKRLNLSGLYLLTDGMKRDFGLEGLQALSVAAPDLTYLHLVGCFQVSKVAIQALAASGFVRRLQDLSLAGCVRLHEAAFINLAHNLGSLRNLNLAGCTEAVTDKMVEAVGRHCPLLEHIDLTECEGVGAHGVKSLVTHCRRMISMDFTGCNRLNDVAMLPFADAAFKPGIETLILVGCPGIGDTGLSWICDGVFKSLVLLNIKGTRCTTSALRSCMDRFRYSKMRKNNSFMGLYPERRWKDRVVINEYGTIYRSAAKLQAAYRARVGRRLAQEAKERFYRSWVATHLQALWRSKQARAFYELLRWEKARKDEAQMVLAGFAKIIAAMEILQGLREEAYLALANKCAIVVQAVYRGRCGRRRVARMIENLRLQRILEDRCARLLQRVYRGHVGKLRFKQMLKEHRDWLAKCIKSASKLQRVWRGKQARRRVAAHRYAIEHRAELEQYSATLLQNRFRLYRCKNIIRRAQAEKARATVAALYVQTAWRARCARMELDIRKQVRQQELEEQAAITLQCLFRVHKAHAIVQELRDARDDYARRLDEAAFMVQRAYRGYQARLKVLALRENMDDLQRKMIELENWAAIRIQSGYRGFGGRKLYKIAMDEHKRAWKEMYDQEEMRPFYYNQITGEIRWRKPQALLDRMRRPLCTNCEFYEAAVECQHCCEFYCNSCWDQVHCGGKRRNHKFRSLYDFYNSRVDYGDDEFPSKWPTEIEQDDMIGWQLRVGDDHDREPAAIQGVWQRFDDEETARSFYYNALTNEGMYDKPPEWSQLEAAEQAKAVAEEEARKAAEVSNAWDVAATIEPGYDATEYDEAAYGDSQSYEVSVWTKAWDDATGREYFYNSVTGESTYEVPHDYQPPAAGAYGGHQDTGEIVPVAMGDTGVFLK